MTLEQDWVEEGDGAGGRVWRIRFFGTDHKSQGDLRGEVTGSRQEWTWAIYRCGEGLVERGRKSDRGSAMIRAREAALRARSDWKKRQDT
jgi:hypothetical protein